VIRRRRRSEPTRGSTGWIARTLSDQGMPPSEVRAVLEAEDHLIVRRYVELHRERLDERLADMHQSARTAPPPTGRGRPRRRCQ
jgi:DNA-binding transcriptional MerR regulator